MKYLFLTGLFSTIFQTGFSQEFTLNDSIFKPGDQLTSYRVMFEFNKGTIREESLPFLDSVVAFLQKHDSLCIEIQNHTDSRGSNAYSVCLSCQRAQAIGEYFTSKGIELSRLGAHGYKDAYPLVSEEAILKMTDKNEIEMAHQKNRRTVFKIISVGNVPKD